MWDNSIKDQDALDEKRSELPKLEILRLDILLPRLKPKATQHCQ